MNGGMADAPVLGTGLNRGVGPSPTSCTKWYICEIAQRPYNQLDRIHSYVVKLHVGDFEMAVNPHLFKRQQKMSFTEKKV